MITHKLKKVVIALLILTLFNACKKDEPEVIPKAIINVVSTAGPKETVTVDGSSSENVTSYNWTVSGPQGTVSYSNESMDNSIISFVPEVAGTYYIELQVTNNNQFSNASATVEVSGGIEIGGTLTESLTLPDINFDGEMCDYYISEDLIIPQDMSLTIESNVKICVAEGVAVISEGYIYTSESGNITFEALGNAWKGIHVKGGSAAFNYVTIDGAGSSSFSSDPDEKAALYLERSLDKLSNCTIKNSEGYGIVMADEDNLSISSFYCTFENNSSGPGIFTLDMVLLSYYGFDLTNENTDSYFKIRGGSSTYNSTLNFVNLNSIPYLILGDITVNTIQMNGGHRIYFADDTGLQATDGFIAQGSESDTIYFESLSQGFGSWKGIYSQGTLSANYISVKYAGSSAWETSHGDYTGALLVQGQLLLRNSNISYNDGYGLATLNYNPTSPSNFYNNTISYNLTGAIATKFDFVSYITAGENLVFEGYAGKPVITVIEQYSGSAIGTWPKLAADIASTDYLILKDADVERYYAASWTVEPGVVIAFDEDVNLEITSGSDGLDAQGTMSEPIRFVGNNSVAGYWGGLYANSASIIKLDYVEINFGGGGTGNYQGCLNVDNSVNSSSSFVTNSSFLNGGTYDLFFPGGVDALDVTDIGNNNIYSTTNI
jgi:hypothetical protein